MKPKPEAGADAGPVQRAGAKEDEDATTPVGGGSAAEVTDEASPPPYPSAPPSYSELQIHGGATNANATSATGQEGRPSPGKASSKV